MSTLNHYQQAIGDPLVHWTPRALPARIVIEGRYCRLEPLNPEHHAADLFASYSVAPDDRGWTYLSIGPFANVSEYSAYLEGAAASADPLHYAVIDLKSGIAVGTVALMRIDRVNGVVEVGFVVFSPLLQRSPLSTEAQYLLMKYVFDELGYRRYEWKCDSLNTPSRQAAARLGFTFEGLFRQAVVYKQRTRDTAWFSIIDSEWPAISSAFEKWLAVENMDEQGVQRYALSEIRSS
jgi:RimJ/RimL family protein N-acetyltransferase